MRYLGTSLYSALPDQITGPLSNDVTSFRDVTDNANDLTLTPNGTDKLQNPFIIGIGRHNKSITPDGQKLVLIIPPSSLSIGSNQVIDSQFTREGFLPTIWGSSQVTLSASGSSPAFILNNSGLATPTSRQDSLGYRHMMALVRMFKSNGYQRLSYEQDPYPGSGKTSSRVPHVLDAVTISYDGTRYFGHFTSFSIEVSAANPFRFTYSFEYTASGIKGDYSEGHLCDGGNQYSGIVIGKQGGNLVSYPGIVGSTGIVLSIADDGTRSSLFSGVTGAESYQTLEESLSGAQVDLLDVFEKFTEAMKVRGYNVVVTSGLRLTAADQERASKQYSGKSAIYGKSLHQYGAAIDINLVNITTGAYITSKSSIAAWEATGVVAEAKKLQIGWGGYFNSGPDPVHFGYVGQYGNEGDMLASIISSLGSKSANGKKSDAKTGVE